MSLVETTSTVGTDPAAVSQFTDFLEQHYADNLKRFPESKGTSFLVSWEALESWNQDVADEVEDKPEKLLYHLESAIREYDESIDSLDDAALRIIDHDREIPVRDIRAREVNELISVEGIVSKATEVKPKLCLAIFQCQECGELFERIQMDEELEKPNGCEACGGSKNNMEVQLRRSKMIDFQKVQIQEPPEDIDGGDNPQAIDVTVLGDATGDVTPGDRVTATGILRGKLVKAGNRGEKSVMSTHLQGLTIEQEEQDFEELVISDEDVEEINELSEDPDVYNRLSASIAPSIFGYSEEKKAMVLQLFSGVPKSVDDGNSTIRGDLHMLFVGDPGTGKSQLIRYVKQLSPRGVFTSGKGSSSAGLTAAAVRDSEFGGDDKWTLQAGALVLADKGVACVDELDKMRSEDRSALHEALEQQTISVNKAGINATLKSRCSLLAAANPEEGRFDDYLSVPDQINLEPPLISRFDLIFIVKDEPEEQKDEDIARHIIKTNRAGQRSAQGKSLKGAFNEDDESEADDVTQDISSDMFRKYVAHARKTCFPELTDEAEDALIEFYVGLRKKGAERDTISITARKLESLVRLAEASARVRLSDVVEPQDAKRAIDLAKYSLRQVGTDPDTGEFDIDMVEAGSSKSQRQRKKGVRELINEICDEQEENDKKAHAPREEILERASEAGLGQDKVEKELKNMQGAGLLAEPKTNHYYVV